MEPAGQLYRDWFNAAVQGVGLDPLQQILAVFDALTEQVQPGQCRGCPFLMTLAEFPDPAHPAHRSAVALKQWVRARLAELTTALGPALDAAWMSLPSERDWFAGCTGARSPRRHRRYFCRNKGQKTKTTSARGLAYRILRS